MQPELTILEPPRGWASINLRELWRYRELFLFMVWRDVKTRYVQSVLGIGWAVLQPLITMVVFTVVFGGLARMSSDGVPYAIFSFAGLVPWTYFANSLQTSSSSLVSASALVTKVYFPRLVIPIAPVLAKLVDFAIAFVVLLVMMAVLGIYPTIWVLFVPVLVLMMIVTACGFGMLLTALSAQYRDVKYALTFGVQLLMYAAPVIYPTSKIPEQWLGVYALNPMVGVIEGFRAALLGTRPMPWDLIAYGALPSVLVLVFGALYFRRMERHFADVI
ncbi:MAG: ABC transporter permease [Acidobacteriota bacterium]